MLDIGEANVDGVDRWILDELAVGGVDHLGLECSCSLSAPAGYCMEPSALCGVDRRGQGSGGYPTCAEEAPPDRHRLPQELGHDGQAVFERRCLGGLHEGDHVAGLGRAYTHGHAIHEELDDRNMEGVGRDVVER